MIFLRTNYKVWALSTLNPNRSRNCPILSEKEMRKLNRGYIKEFVDTNNKIVVTSWFDNKRVLTLSNYIGKNPVGTCKRYDAKQKKKIEVKRPACIQIYNKFMGGVDKADMLLSLYCTRYRSKKWYHRLAFHLFSQAAVNSWIVYSEIGGNKPLVDFLADICISMIMNESTSMKNYENALPGSRSMRAVDIPKDVRLDKHNHWPVLLDVKNSQRCKYESCIKKTKYQCSKCKIYLCVANNKCFLAFHGVE
ncbi:piggyBac transposable element-derived protein 2-like [Hydra vulgaris]|uniref:piggyBac transposable element-derived protein 2-like n=1 Tax=Hydra vulgaris TaxID=6087 RepID=UPI001F5FA97D|nr:piggyBac transposable element-derived protein 2-like [Hydra vulgaris]